MPNFIFQSMIALLGLLQLVLAILFISGGDFGTPAVFSSAWLVPSIFCFVVGFGRVEPIWIAICLWCYIGGIALLWLGYFYSPRWLYGNVLTSYGAHTLFASMASIVNLPGMSICFYQLGEQRWKWIGGP